MIDLRTDFQERVNEVDAYMKLVTAIEHAAQQGTPILRNRKGDVSTVEPLQQKIIYGGVYIYLYNLVEATVSRCIAAIENAASAASRWRADDLSTQLRSEWVRSVARTHEDLATENRFKAAIDMCEHLVAMLPVSIKIERGGGGNWDDIAIARVANRIGVQLQLNVATESRIKRHVRDNKGPLALIKHLRNKLAHGEMSFSECGDGRTSTELEELVSLTKNYLEEVITSFETFIARYEFLQPARRPASGGA